MNVNYKKSLKIVTLLISALIIGSVSAATFNYMYINGTGTITSTGLKWESGVDDPGSTITGPSVSVPLTTNLGNPRNYTDCLHIVNQDSGSSHSFNITVTSSTGDIDQFTEFNLVLFNTAGDEMAVLNLLTEGSGATLLSIGASQTWRVLFELIPIAEPTPDAQVTFTVTMVYE
jgi:hypothetical protein